MPYKTIKVKELKDGVVLIQLHRPKKLNALSYQLTEDLLAELRRLDQLPLQYGCVVLYGNPKVFCAGADISELKAAGNPPKNQDQGDSRTTRDPVKWSVELPKIRIPIIAAVDGFCLGGGCELAMLCDVIYATSRARFGQPEIKIGVVPGGGGTQRLPRAIGKLAATELILTGDQFSAKRAHEWGLVSKLFESNEKLMQGAIATAKKISRGPRDAVLSGKQAIRASFNLGVDEGCKFERSEFQLLLSSEDKNEGMAAFLKRRSPVWEWQRKEKSKL